MWILEMKNMIAQIINSTEVQGGKSEEVSFNGVENMKEN